MAPPPRTSPQSPLIREGTLSDRIVESFYGFWNNLYPGNFAGLAAQKGERSFFPSGVHECAPEMRSPDRRRRTRPDVENEPPPYRQGSPANRRHLAAMPPRSDFCSPRKSVDDDSAAAGHVDSASTSVGGTADGGYVGDGGYGGGGSSREEEMPAMTSPGRGKSGSAGVSAPWTPALDYRSDDSVPIGAGDMQLSSVGATSPRWSFRGSERLSAAREAGGASRGELPVARPGLTASARSLHDLPQQQELAGALHRQREELAHLPQHDQGRNVGSPRSTPYLVDQDDILDQHVGWYLRRNPEVRTRHSIARKSPGLYELDGREVRLEWQHSPKPGGQGYLVVVDWPLRQPFSDYMEESEHNAQYDGQDVGRSSLHQIPKEQRLSFNDTHKVYSRLEAMKVAKEQALYREKAANYVKEGHDVPNELLNKYKKSLQVKLGVNRQPQRKMERPPERQAPPPPVAVEALPTTTIAVPTASALPAARQPSVPLGPSVAPPAAPSAAAAAGSASLIPAQGQQQAPAQGQQHASAPVQGMTLQPAAPHASAQQMMQPRQMSCGALAPHLQPHQVSRSSQQQLHPPQLSRGPPPPPPPRAAQQQQPQQQRVAAMAQAVQAASCQTPMSQRATVGGACGSVSSNQLVAQQASGRQSPMRSRATVGATSAAGQSQASASMSPTKHRQPPQAAPAPPEGYPGAGGSHVSSVTSGYPIATPMVQLPGGSLSASTAGTSTGRAPTHLWAGGATTSAPPPANSRPVQAQIGGLPHGIATAPMSAQCSAPPSPSSAGRQLQLPPPPPPGVGPSGHWQQIPPGVVLAGYRLR